MMSHLLSLLYVRRFLPLFITQFFGAFNDNAFKQAFLIWFTYDIAAKTGADSALMVTFAAGLFILPFLLFSYLAGQVADKYEKSWLTTRIKLVEIVLMIAMSICFFAESVNGLLVILFFMGIQSTFFGPIKYSLLPEHLKKGELIAGNGLIEGGTFLSILLGTIFGGLVISMVFGLELFAMLILIFALIGWVSSFYIPTSSIGDKNLEVDWHIITKTWQIIGYAKEHSTVWLSVLGISWFWLIGATFLTQFPTYTKIVIGGDEQVVTLFLTMFVLGIASGSLWCNYLLKGEVSGRFVPLGCLAMSFAIFILIVLSYVYQVDYVVSDEYIGVSAFLVLGWISWAILLALLLLSISAGIYVVPLYALVQHLSKDKFLARIIAANNVMNALFMVVASLITLLLFSIGFDVKGVLLTLGVFNLIVYAVLCKKHLSL